MQEVLQEGELREHDGETCKHEQEFKRHEYQESNDTNLQLRLRTIKVITARTIA